MKIKNQNMIKNYNKKIYNINNNKYKIKIYLMNN